MWHQIALNKRRTVYVILFMGTLFLLFGAALGYLFEGTYLGMTIGIAVLFILYICTLIQTGGNLADTYFDGAYYKYNKNVDSKIYNIVEEMCIASGLSKVPNIYILDINIPNAFAFGISPDKSSICLTKGLLKLLNRDELQGVIAHEISHIVNRDTMYLLYAGVLVNLIGACTNAYLRNGLRSSSKSSGNIITCIFIVIFIILSPVFAQLFYFSLSRKREFLADACAARYTRYPNGLAAALEKISSVDLTVSNYFYEEHDFNSSNNLFIKASCITPLKSKKKDDFDLFQTHPSTLKRIEILRSMTGADYTAYNEACSKILKYAVINKKDASKCDKIPVEIPRDLTAASFAAAINKDMISRGITNSDTVNMLLKQESYTQKLNKARETDDLLWKLAGYTFIECPCNTKLKIPSCYKGKMIECPHCKKKYRV